MPRGKKTKMGKAIMYIRMGGSMMNRMMNPPQPYLQGFWKILIKGEAKLSTCLQPLLMTSPYEILSSSCKKISEKFLRIRDDTHASRCIVDLQYSRVLDINLHGFLNTKWLVPPNSKCHRIQTS